MKPKIIIIGAGIAGLVACHYLKQSGFDVVILEARNRVGGRIHTDFSLGFPVNCGASWIHGIENNPITELANNTHSKIIHFNHEKIAKYDRNGCLIPSEIVYQFEEKFEKILQETKKLAFDLSHDISLSTAFSKILHTERFSSAEDDLFQMKKNYFSGFYGADYDKLSARHWNSEEVLPGGNYYLPNGYHHIINKLSENVNIQLNTIVKEIHLQKNNVKVVTENSILKADAVISTLPIGVLKKNAVAFYPSLPETKQKAIQKLGSGLLNMAAFKFPKVFWPHDHQAFTLSCKSITSIPVFFNLEYFLDQRQPALMVYYGGEKAHAIEQLTNPDIQEIIMQELKTIFGNSIPQPETMLATRWSQDQYSYSSYSYMAVGATPYDCSILAEQIDNRLFFAGEATSERFFATTHGAYLSGMREGEKIRKSYNE